MSNGRDQIDCIDDHSYDTLIRNNYQTAGCGMMFSQCYFITFTIIISWLIMNLSVAAVIEGLENAKQQNHGVITGDDVNELIEAWKEYDPQATGWIGLEDFICLVIDLPQPFGSKKLNEQCSFKTKKAFAAEKRKIYNKDSFYVHNEK